MPEQRAEQKQWQRLRGRSALTAFDPARRKPASAAIRARLEALPAWRQARRIALYAPFPAEPNPGWPTPLTDDGAPREIYFPRTVFDPAEPAITLHRVRAPEELRPGHGARGLILLEPPAEAPEADYGALDLILVPGLAFNREGHRLGRGGGYYDRLLARLPERTLRIGLFFAVQELAQIAHEPHDRRLNWIVTENERITPLPHPHHD